MAGSAQIGSLRVMLGLDSAQFSAGVAGAQSSLQRLSGTFKSFAAGAVAALSLGTLVGAFTSVTERIDAMGKASQKIGIPVQELSKLSYAAKLADVPMETLQTSISKLSKGLNEFQATGKGDVGAALRAIGVSATLANGQLRPTSAIMEDIAAKFAQYEDGANKTALAIALFGKSGADMIPLLNGGREGLKQAGDEAKRFGLVVSEQAARAAEQFNDNITRLTSAGQGLAQIVAGPVVQSLAELTDQLLAWVDVGSNGEAVTNSISQSMQILGDYVRATAAEIRKIAAVWGAFSDMTSGNTGPMGPLGRWRQLQAEIDSINDGLVRQNQLARESITISGEGKTSVPEAPKKRINAPNFASVDVQDKAREASAKKAHQESQQRLREAMSSYTSTSSALEKYNEDVKNLTYLLNTGAITQAQFDSHMKTLKDTFNGTTEKINQAKQAFTSSAGPIEKYKQEVADLDLLLRSGVITQEQYNDRVQRLRQGFAQAAPDVESFGEKLASTFQDTALNWLDQAIDGAFRFKDALKDLAKTLAKLAANNLLTQLFSSSAGGIYEGGGGGFGGFIKGLFGFAKGGTIMPGGSGGIDSQIVAFRKSPSERVDITKPGQSLSVGSSGGSSTINIDARGADAGQIASLKQYVQEMSRNFERNVKATVSREKAMSPRFAT